MSSTTDAATDPKNGESLSDIIVVCAVVMTTLASFTVGLRFYVRGKLLRAIRKEDWFILVALMSSIISSGFVIKESRVGFGRHMATVSAEEMISYTHASYFMTLFYNLSLFLTKISILIMFLRVLTHEYIRKATYATLGLVVVYNVWAFGMYFTMCIPIQRMWDRSIPGYCHPLDVWWALTYLHIVTDFMIFCLPIPVVATMTIPMRQKASLLLVFCVGFFVCLISVLRTIWLNQLLYMSDVTWELVSIGNWSVVEVNTAIVCACVMTLKPLLRKLFGPLAQRLFPNQHEHLGEGQDERPRTIGSMPMNAMQIQGRNRNGGLDTLGNSLTSWADGTTLGNASSSREEVIPGARASKRSSQVEVAAVEHSADADADMELGLPPRAHVKN
ncbi:hypothetical protein B0H67DRAFT_149203 [Lasiosphaeris hirsuta]|uniref:Rhodopsin domain-containing protein n=1 Tax=Lasiosphaeris hirsuta TaxID=260670 RepID=A0AA40ANS3_9PEZI|nr:hypothetical protein B0H67DRAFT_149203 [Lasiosphaeris hirsuta]